jgi:exodeoxyribonuclease VII large subunit
VLARGFVIVRDSEGKVLTRAEAAARAKALELQFSDGRVSARPDRQKTSRKAPPKATPGQGTLL